MKTSDICRKDVVTASPRTTLAGVAQLMRRHHVGSVVVVDSLDARRPIGIVTDRDIVIEVVAAGEDPSTLTAGEIMTSPPVTAAAADEASWTLKIMRDHGVRRLPVLDATGAMVGIVALDDLLNAASAALADVVQAIGTGRVEETAHHP
jgi:CBS domain-containing protein